MALNTITGAGFPASASGHVGPFRDGNGNLYVISRRSSTDEIGAWKSINGGSSWSEQDFAGRPVPFGIGTTVAAVAAVQSGTTIHVAAHSDFPGGKTQNVTIDYMTFHTSDAGSNPDEWVIGSPGGETVVTVDVGDAADVTEAGGIEIAVRSDGDVIVFHPGSSFLDMGTDYFNLAYSRRESASWTTDIALNNEAFNQSIPKAVIAPNDECHFSYSTGSGNPQYAATLDSGNNISTRVEIDDPITATPVSGRPITWDNGGTQQILVLWASGGADIGVRRMAEDGNGDITTDLAVANPFSIDVIGSSFYNTALAWDPLNGDAYLFGVQISDGDLYYDVGANGTGWGTDVELEDAITCNGVWANYYNSKIGYVVLDGTTLKYGELALTGPQTVNVTAVTESESAQAVTALFDQTISVTNVSESEAAQTITPTIPAGDGQNGFRIRSGDTVGLNVNSGWAAAQDTSASMAILDRPFRIRFLVANNSGGGVTDGYQVRVSIDGGAYQLIQNNSDPYAVTGDQNKFQVEAIPSSQYADLDATTQLLGSGTFVAGDGNEDNTQASLTLNDGEETELEWTINVRKLARNIANSANVHTPDGTTFDFRVYYDDGTALPEYNETPRVTIANRPGHIGGTWVETSYRNWIPDKSGNLYYLCEYADLPTTAAAPVMMKSTDGGDSWNPVDEVGAPAQDDVESIDMHYTASTDTIHIAFMGTGNNDARYWTFNTADHATNADQWDLNELVTATITPGDQCVGIQRRSDNTTVLFYQGNLDAGVERIRYKIRSSGGTWGGENTVDTEASTNIDQVRTALDPATDTIHIFYHAWDGVNGEVWHKTLNSSDTLSGRNQVDQAVTIDAGGGSRVGAVAGCAVWNDGGTVKVGVAYHEDTGDSLYWNETAVGTIDWTANEQVALASVENNAVSNSSVNGTAVVSDADDEVWVMGIDSTDFHLEYDWREGGTWQGDVDWNTEVGYEVQAGVFTHSGANGGARVIGFIHHEKWGQSYTILRDGSGFVRYDEIVLAAGAEPAFPPFSRRQLTTVRM